jgi:sulfite exporter TauE/SafE
LSLGFAAGRFLGYFTLGIIAALMGGAFLGFFENTYPSISSWIVAIFGLSTILMGVFMLSKTKIGFFGEKRCQTYMGRMQKFNNPLVGSGFLGFISTITPCVPVFTFLLLPFALGRVWETAAITVAFGFGANIVFIVIAVAMSLGVKNINEMFQEAKKGMEVVSALALIVFGTFYMLWAGGPVLFGWANNNYALPTAFDFMDFVKYLVGAP